MTPLLPSQPPYTLRTRLLTPIGDQDMLWLEDAAIVVDADGRLADIGPWEAADDDRPGAVDLRPWVVMPGLVDLHAHLPQLPNAGVGAGLHLLDWLERYIFPLERDFDEETAERLAPAAFRAFARAGTTTVVAYGAIWEPSLDACFRAAEAARHPGGDRQGDDGSPLVRHRSAAAGDPGAVAAAVDRAVRALARP